MANWVYLLAKNDKYPSPEVEIDSLATLEKEKGACYLLLANRKWPPGINAQPGDNVFLCVRQNGRNVGRAKAYVTQAAEIRPKAPPGLEVLYPVAAPRHWLRISIDKFSAPQTEEELGLPKNCFQFERTQAYVRLLKAAASQHL